MKKEDKSQHKLPERFPSYSAAADFWDTHDSAEFVDDLSPVSVEVQLKRRHFEIEVDEEVVRVLEKRARVFNVPTDTLANELLRKDLALV